MKLNSSATSHFPKCTKGEISLSRIIYGFIPDCGKVGLTTNYLLFENIGSFTDYLHLCCNCFVCAGNYPHIIRQPRICLYVLHNSQTHLASPLIFSAYSQRFVVSTLSKRMNLSLPDASLKSRTIRLLWFMREMGCGWLSTGDLEKIGAAGWRTLPFIIPVVIRDNLVDIQPVTKIRSNYKINATGLELLQLAEVYVQEEYNRAVNKCEVFKLKHGISKLPF